MILKALILIDSQNLCKHYKLKRLSCVMKKTSIQLDIIIIKQKEIVYICSQ